jgi:hypothetical protein
MAQTAVGNHTLTLAETPTGLSVSGGGAATLYPAGSSTINMACIAGDTWYQLGMLSSAASSVPPGYNITYTPTGVPTGYNYISGSIGFASTSTNTGGGAHNHPITMAIQYCDVILASKN